MSVIYTREAVKYLREISKISETPEDDLLKKKKRRKKNYVKLYQNDTSKFEPIQENREHLINCLIPLVIKLANQRIEAYGLPNELSDVLSAGFQGAIIATDIYIEKSKTEVQPAKLSTYAYSYIVKYINEFMYQNSSILSFGTTKSWDVRTKTVLRGNAIGVNQNQGEFKEEYFETSGEINLMSRDEYDNSTELSEQISSKLFDSVTKIEKIIVFMHFGIGFDRQHTIKEIAKAVNISKINVEKILASSLEKMKNVFSQNESNEVYEILAKSDLTRLSYWQNEMK